MTNATPFEDSALKAFGSLQHEYGYKCMKRNHTEIVFESGAGRVRVTYYAHRYELDLSVCLKATQKAEEVCFNSDRLATLGLLSRDAHARLFASEPAMPVALEMLAHDIATHCRDLLLGKRDAFAQAEEVIRVKDMEDQEKRLADDARRQALEAFEQEKWQAVISSYEACGQALSPVEQKRLDIARKRANISRH